mmetsp:Transcript_47556/g.126983  ORF Transcript_47556/g.126983 Transcript_47556/m.126983 type:complete len:91 (-) Transcript_47556:563-835(-)
MAVGRRVGSGPFDRAAFLGAAKKVPVTPAHARCQMHFFLEEKKRAGAQDGTQVVLLAGLLDRLFKNRAFAKAAQQLTGKKKASCCATFSW